VTSPASVEQVKKRLDIEKKLVERTNITQRQKKRYRFMVHTKRKLFYPSALVKILRELETLGGIKKKELTHVEVTAGI